MKTILKRLQDLADDDLYALCEAVDRNCIAARTPTRRRRFAFGASPNCRARAELPPPQWIRRLRRSALSDLANLSKRRAA